MNSGKVKRMEVIHGIDDRKLQGVAKWKTFCLFVKNLFWGVHSVCM